MRERLLEFASRIARRVARNRYFRDLAAPPTSDSLRPLDDFVTAAGTRIRRYEGYRDLVVPRWRAALAAPSPPGAVDASAVARARREVGTLEEVLDRHGRELTGARVLEVGCHAGAHTFALAERGASHVLGIDIPAYGVRQTQGTAGDDDALPRQSKRLEIMRETMRASFVRDGGPPAIGDVVTFQDLDVEDLVQESAFDLVVSWETLEHLPDPAVAMAKLHDALAPGGFAFHEYNPFFAVNGGHSLCTLDFPWGHAQLDDADFVRYVREHRPTEEVVATAFFRDSLNRMTQEQLRRHCLAAGFARVDVCGWAAQNELSVLEADTLARCRAVHPEVTLSDLLSRIAWVVTEKSAG